MGSYNKSAPVPIRSPYGSTSRNIYSFSPAGVSHAFARLSFSVLCITARLPAYLSLLYAFPRTCPLIFFCFMHYRALARFS